MTALPRVLEGLAHDARARWSACVQDAATGRVLAELDADVLGPTASVGKLLLLVEVARGLESGQLAPDELLSRTGLEPVADSGLWQHLRRTGALALEDLAVLVGATSDNLATNVLLDRVGLAAVRRTGAGLGLPVHLHDRVRDARGPQHPPALSTATARGLAELLGRLSRGQVHGPAVSQRVLSWLEPGHDLSMVAGRWGLDPLAHAGAGLWSKTGTDEGVRADTGLLVGGGRGLAYAVVARWDGPGDPASVLEGLRDVGDALQHELRCPPAPAAPGP